MALIKKQLLRNLLCTFFHFLVTSMCATTAEKAAVITENKLKTACCRLKVFRNLGNNLPKIEILRSPTIHQASLVINASA